MEKKIKHDSRLICPAQIPECVKYSEFVKYLDKKYGIDSSDDGNSFGQVNLTRPLVSEQPGNFYYFLRGRRDAHTLPKQMHTVLPFNTVLTAGTLYGNAAPLVMEEGDMERYFAQQDAAYEAAKKEYEKLEKEPLAGREFGLECHFKIGKRIDEYFTVEYEYIEGNRNPYFSTSYMGWQNQEDMPEHELAYKFYKKWDIFHTVPMTEGELSEMKEDLEELKAAYKWKIKEYAAWNPKIRKCEGIETVVPDTVDRDRFLTLAYGQYQANWMHWRGHTLKDIMERLGCETAMDVYKAFAPEDIAASMRMHAEDLHGLVARIDEAAGCGGTLSAAFEEWEMDAGFSGEIYACRDEFEDVEFKDEDCMKGILTEEEFGAWLALQGRTPCATKDQHGI